MWTLCNRDMNKGTDAMLNAIKRDTHRALADWVGDREPWPGWFGQGL